MTNRLGNPEPPRWTEKAITAHRSSHEDPPSSGEIAQTVSDLDELERQLARLLLEVFLSR